MENGGSIPECNVCGKEMKTLYKVKIEGSMLEVCNKCLSFGKKLETPKGDSIRIRSEKPPIEETILVENYGDVIKRAREKIGLDRKQFAEKIAEKESLIKRIEFQEMFPDKKVMKKIENTLKIKLAEKQDIKTVKTGKKKTVLTLGDIIEIK